MYVCMYSITVTRVHVGNFSPCAYLLWKCSLNMSVHSYESISMRETSHSLETEQNEARLLILYKPGSNNPLDIMITNTLNNPTTALKGD